MSLFVEVYDLKKSCEVIINLDTVAEISPLKTGGCEVSFNDGASVGGRRVVNVREDFSMFQQLVMTMVTPEDMQARIAKINKAAGVEDKPEATPHRGRGRPPKSAAETFDIPRL